MRLIVENFRCYSNKHEWEFTDGGITLLSGKSGSGKTSIIMAINFVLTNSKKHSKLIADGKNSMKVELIYRNSRIVRTKRPDRLIFFPDASLENYVEEAEAQARIDSIFGPFFEWISYIPQQYEKSFLYQDSSEKLRLLEKLTFPSDSQFLPDVLKKKCSDVQKNLNEEILTLRSQILEIQNTFEEVLHPPDERTVPDITEDFCKNQLSWLHVQEKNISLLQKRVHILDDLRRCENELKSYNELYCDKNSVYERISNITELKRINDMLLEIPLAWQKYKKEEAEEFIEDYRKDIALLEEYNTICIKLDSIQKDAEQLDNLYWEKSKLEKACEKILQCPNCDISLALQESVLRIISDEKDILKLETSKRQVLLKTIQQKIDTLLQTTKSMSYLEEKKLQINESIDVTENLDKLKDDLKWLTQYIDTNVRYESRQLQAEKGKRELLQKLGSTGIDSTDDEIASLKKKLDGLNKKEYLENKKKQLTLELSQVDHTLCTDSLMTNEEIQAQKEYYNSIIYEWMEYKIFRLQKEKWDVYISAKSRMQSMEKQLEKLRKELDATIRLKQLILVTESEMIEKNMDHIQNLVNMYCSKLFEEPLTVYLSTQKRTQTQTEKVQVTLNVYYKQINCDISYLSGGEQARLNLAFILAFAHVFGSPLLLLDECTSNLDQELTDTVMEQISDVQIPKVILIAHQIVEGKFEQIIHC